MRAAALLLLVSAGAAQEEPAPRWRFDFRNGDRLHGELRRIRDGALTLSLESDPHRVLSVPLRKVTRASRLATEEEDTGPEEIVRLRDDTVLLGRFRGVVDGKIEFKVRTIGRIALAGDEVAEYLPTEAVVRAYYRTLTAPRTADLGFPISRSRFAALWRDLGQEDRNDAWEAQRVLARAGPYAVAHLGERLRYLPDAPARLRRLVAWLDHEDPEIRRLAHAELFVLRHVAEPVLRDALPTVKAPEARRRIEELLVPAPIEPDDARAHEDVRRVLRAIALLEEMGSPEARDVLSRVAAGDPAAATVRAARESLHRLGAAD